MKRVIRTGVGLEAGPFVIGVLYSGVLIGFLTKGRSAQQNIDDSTAAHGPRLCKSMQSAKSVISWGGWNRRVMNNRSLVVEYLDEADPIVATGGVVGRSRSVYHVHPDWPIIDMTPVSFEIYLLADARNMDVVSLDFIPSTTLEEMYPGISKYCTPDGFFSFWEYVLGKAGVFENLERYNSLADILDACVDPIVNGIKNRTSFRDGDKRVLKHVPDEIYDKVVSKLGEAE